MSDPLNDPREVRKLMNRVRFRGERLDGKDRNSWSPVSSMTRYVMDAGEHDGWHGEDTMTMLAYYALLELEKFYDMQLNILNTTPLAKVILPIKEAP